MHRGQWPVWRPARHKPEPGLQRQGLQRQLRPQQAGTSRATGWTGWLGGLVLSGGLLGACTLGSSGGDGREGQVSDPAGLSSDSRQAVQTRLAAYLGQATVLEDTRSAIYVPEGLTLSLNIPVGIDSATVPTLAVGSTGGCAVTLRLAPAPGRGCGASAQEVVLGTEDGWKSIELSACAWELSSRSECGASAALSRIGLPDAWLTAVAESPSPSLWQRLSRWFASIRASNPQRLAPEGALGGSGAGAERTPGGKPDIVLISIDTLRPDYLSPYGDPMMLAPNIARLASQGTVYLRARAHAPWTGPSVAALMTGRMSAGLERMAELAPTLPTLGEQLQAAGYRTLAAVNNPRLAANTGMSRGFDRYRAFGEDEELLSALPELLETKAASPGPTFLWVHLLGPHLPLDPNPDDLAAVGWDPALGDPVYEEGEVIKPDAEFSEQERHKIKMLYRADIHHADRNLGSILALVDQQFPGATIVLTSDHGEELWEHGAHGHGHAFWKELLAVPLIARGPLWKAAETVPELVRLCELAPTFLSLAGAEKPSTMICGTLQDRAGHPRSMAGNPLKGPRLVTVEGPIWKLMREEGGKVRALYRVAEGETVDHASEAPEVVATFQEEAEAFIGRSRALLGPSRVVLTLTGARATQVDVTLTSGKPITLLPQLPPGRVGVVTVSEEGRRWRIQGRARVNDPDQILFEVELGASDHVDAEVTVDGKTPAPTQWRVGGIPVTAGPFHLMTDQEGWRGDPPEGGGLTVDLWFRPRGEPPREAIFSPEELARLRALGYAE